MASNVDGYDKKDILDHGRALYRDKEYKDALQCFNTVVSREDEFLYTALDNRAATHTRLGDLESALRDGRRMIKEERSSSAGYLRSGKILQLLGKEAVALGIYTYGLSNVSPEDSNFELLQSMRDKLRRESKAVDFVQFLPLELTQMIMHHFDFKTAVRLLRVSRLWNSTLSSFPTVWQHVDFSRAFRPVSMVAVRGYVRRSQRTIKRLTLHLRHKTHDDILNYVTRHCKALQHLDIISGSAGNTILSTAPSAIELKILILADCEVTLETVCQLLFSCSNLERAEFRKVHCYNGTANWQGNMSKIRTLVINAKFNERPECDLNTSALLKRIPNAQTLTMNNWRPARVSPEDWDFSVIPNLQSLEITHNSNIVFPRLPHSLRTLNLSYCIPCRQLKEISLANMKESPLPEMKNLLLSSYYHMTPSRLLALLSPCKEKLELLKLEHCNLQAQDITSLIQNGFLKNIIHLSLAGIPVDDACVELLATNLHHLKCVDLSSTLVTGVGVKALVLRPTAKLERLDLIGCNSVSVDAVHFARLHGIDTFYFFPEPLRNAKKVVSW